MGRDFCYRCYKPRARCMCGTVPVVANRVPVWILQHFRERFHPIGTARLAMLGLEQCRCVVAYSGLPGNSTSRLEKGVTRTSWGSKTLLTPMDLPDGVAVLYPSEKAIPLEECEPPSGLLVLDATWAHAKRLYYENPWIADLPHVSLTPAEPSRYRIRKEPELHCLSTLEAIVCALKILEPDTPGFTGLLQSFDHMIETQSRFIPDLPC